MVISAAVTLILLVTGNVLAEALSLPLPGAALGLLVLTVAFAVRGGPDPGSEALFDFAAPYFPLFFVPAAVGVIANIDILLSAWTLIVAAVIAGTAITLVATGLVFQSIKERRNAELRP